VDADDAAPCYDCHSTETRRPIGALVLDRPLLEQAHIDADPPFEVTTDGHVFLALEDVLLLHEDWIARYGGTLGVRDIGLLQSALGMPAAASPGALLHDSVPHMASAYLVHIAKNHPFLDGNTRTALAAGIAFFGLNAWSLDADPDELIETVLGWSRARSANQRSQSSSRSMSVRNDVARADPWPLRQGKLMQLGAPRAVYTRPANRTVADFMGLVNLVPARMVRATGDNGIVAVADSHEVAVALPPRAAPGQRVQLAIHPENVRLMPIVPGRAAEAGLVPGTVAEVTFLGNLTDCYVTLADGTRVRVQADPGTTLEVGHAVAVSFDTRAASVFEP
jgi:prophage maintenance system killer protein